jgi:hypothetical protein
LKTVVYSLYSLPPFPRLVYTEC